MTEPAEEWRVIPQFPHYSASNLGRIRRDTAAQGTSGNLILKPNRSLRYLTVAPCMNGKGATQYVHRLVALAFIGEPPAVGMQVAHINGDPRDNRPENLRWSTPAENNKDKLVHGTHQRGDRHHLRKVSSADVLEIRRRAEAGDSRKAIANNYGLHVAYVSLVVNRKRWAHL